MSYKEKFDADFKFGTAKEDEGLNQLRSRFGNEIVKCPKNFVMDFEGTTCYLELKSRKCKKDTYPTTMVGENKIQFARQAKKEGFSSYFCFLFEDGFYFWSFNERDIESGKVTFEMGGRYDRGRVERKLYAFIDKDLLVAL